MKKEVLNLGKQLVKELGLELSVDTLSRWMAHYIAQQMAEIEEAASVDKEVAEVKCFETILKLWKHRAYYEKMDKPFENFKPIFETLDRLNPDNKEPYYFQSTYSLTRDNLEDYESDAVKQYLLLATKIDEIARIWLKFIFQQAAEQALDEKTKEWIEVAAPLIDNDETSLIIRILSNQDIDEDNKGDNTAEQVKLLEHRIEQLKSFRELNEELILMYEEKLKEALD